MALSAAVGKADWVFDMEHLVVKDIRDNIFRNTWAVELAIHYDLA
jgi:hypothetical protein